MGKQDRHQTDWEPTTLQAAIDARSLHNYTTHIIANPKVFSPDDDWRQTTLKRIYNTSLSIYMDTWAANRRDARISEDVRDQRFLLQAQAIAGCDDLLALIELAQPQFHVAWKKIHYWGKKTIDTQNRIIAWHKADKERYK